MASVMSANPFDLLEQEEVVTQDAVLTKDERPKTGSAQPLNKKGKKPPTDIRREPKKPGHHAKGKKHGELGDRQSGTGYGPNKTSKRGGGGAYNVGGQSEVQAEAEEALAKERGQRRRRRAAETEPEEEEPQATEPEEEGIDLVTFKKQQRELAVQLDKKLKIRDASQAKDDGQFKKVTEFEYKSEFSSEEVLFVLKDDIEHKKAGKKGTQRAKAKQIVQIEPLSYQAQEASRSRRGGRGGPRGDRGGDRSRGGRPFRERRERTEYQQQEQPTQEPAPVTGDEAQGAPAKVPAEETTPTPEAADDGFKTAPQRSSRRGRGAGGERGERGRGGRGRGRGGRGRGGGDRGRGGSERSNRGGSDRGNRGSSRGAPRGGERGMRRGGRGGSRGGGANRGRQANFVSDESAFPPLA